MSEPEPEYEITRHDFATEEEAIAFQEKIIKDSGVEWIDILNGPYPDDFDWDNF